MLVCIHELVPSRLVRLRLERRTRGSSNTSSLRTRAERRRIHGQRQQIHVRGALMVVRDEWRAVHALLLSIVESKKSSSCSDKVWRCCTSTGSGG
jgi:hypothetical protein